MLRQYSCKTLGAQLDSIQSSNIVSDMVVEENDGLSVSDSQPKVDSILDRRRQLKLQRRTRLLTSIWRTGAIGSFMLILGWGLSQPEWKIRSLEQVNILGNTQLSNQTLEQLLPLTYPTSLIHVQPQKIADQLQSYAHIQQAVVSRQLLPPQITVVVQERLPVAKTTCKGCVLVHQGQTPFPKSDTWLIDAEGVVLPLASYPEMQRTQSLPSLDIQGYLVPHPSKDLQQQGKPIEIAPKLQAQVKKILPMVLASPVAIKQLDLRDETNLKFLSPLGIVHLAQFNGDTQKMKLQLESLDKLRSLSKEVDLSKIQYLDLSDPARPSLTLKDLPTDPKDIGSE